ncbi:MAG: hypothetical protein MUO77_21500, partial [Anaerolineales bacterium]|nr:hypothetical protein [Anaerolineales bacterium]
SGTYVFVRLRFVFRQILSVGLLSWLAFIALFIYALYMAAASTLTYDTGLYHAQSIRWIESYPAIPGLANLHDRLGFNSNLFLLAAFWGFADEGWFAYQIPGLVIFASFLIYCLYLINKSRHTFALSGLVAAGFLFYLLVEQGIIVWFVSPTADLSSTFLSWMIFLLAMEKLESDDLTQLDVKTIAIFTLCLFNISVKLSAAPILLVPLYFLWKIKPGFSLWNIVWLTLFGAVIFIPWLVRNAIISGYLVFPFYQLDILNVDWKVPYEAARHATEVVVSWGRVPYADSALVMPMKFNQWFPVWYQTLPPADFYLIGSILVTSVLLGVFAVFDHQVRERMARYGVVYVILIVWGLYWFIQSPSPRFGYGFLATMLFIACSPLIEYLLYKVKIPTNLFVLLMQILLISYTVKFESGFPARSWKHYLNSYKPYPVAETSPAKIENMVLFIPSVNEPFIQDVDAQCWYDAFPCAPFEPSGLSLRGAKIEDGFYIKGK